MTKHRAVWLVMALAMLAAFAVLIPGSPVYLPKLLITNARYDDHTTNYWIEALDSPDREHRKHAIRALGAIGAQAGEAVPALARILREDPDAEARSEAGFSLMKMAPASRTAVPALAEALEDKEPWVRMKAAMALFSLRTEARAAIPALIKAQKDDSNQTNLEAFHFTIQEMATLALGRASAGSAEAVPVLTAALEADDTDEMHMAAARALGEVGTPARPAAALLRALLKEKNKDLRLAAEEALKKIGAPLKDKKDPAKAGRGPEEKELPPAERKYLWEIEHQGNLLAKYGFGPLALALRNADTAALSRFLADDFRGADMGQPKRVRAAVDYAEIERLQDAGHLPQPLNRDAFIARLLQFRKVFGDRPPKVKFALMTLGPQRRGKLDGGWQGTAQLRLHGEHARGAPAEVVAVLRYQIARPTQQALSRPGWLRSARVLQVQIAKAPRYLFAEVARQRGIDTSKLHDNWTCEGFNRTPGGVFVCDFNRDGILDVLVTDVKGCTLYQGRADGTFEDVTARCGLPRRGARPVVAWVDIDGDGWEDLILGGRVYRNEGGKRFVDYTDRCNLRLPSNALSVVVADYDCDGKVDLYVTCSGKPGWKSWLDGRSSDRGGNYLFRNKGNWQFEDVTRASGSRGGRRSTFTAAWLDANNDGWPDLHVINEFGDGVLLINNRDGTFREHALADRPADFGSMGLAVGDINNDGNIDIYCANMYSKAGTRVIGNLAPDAYPPDIMAKMRRFVAGSQLHLNRGGLKFDQVGPQMQVAGVGWAYGACLADLDNDGWLDLYATAGFVSSSRDKPDG
jgi:HEAT repeat protein